ncbi:MAG: DNA replication/repair protein RecF, partial [Alphaproteobacteria bacterium]
AVPGPTGEGCVSGGRRQVRIDGKPQRGQGALAARLGLVWLTPAMDRLFLDGAGARRRFLDRLAFGHDPGHADRLAQYERSLGERARLLRKRGRDGTWLAALEAQMARHGVALAASRLDVAERLDGALARADGPFPSARVRAQGTLEAWLGQAPAVVVEERFAARLAANRARDAEIGGAAEGPQRSDFAVHDRATGRAAPKCSTGEQKALLVAIVLADAGLVAQGPRGAPILLLDDVAAHLDDDRRRALFDALDALGGQAWLSGTDRASFAGLEGRARFLAVGPDGLAEAG